MKKWWTFDTSIGIVGFASAALAFGLLILSFHDLAVSWTFDSGTTAKLILIVMSVGVVILVGKISDEADEYQKKVELRKEMQENIQLLDELETLPDAELEARLRNRIRITMTIDGKEIPMEWRRETAEEIRVKIQNERALLSRCLEISNDPDKPRSMTFWERYIVRSMSA